MTRAILLDENGCKPCSKCKEVKHFSLFTRKTDSVSGFASQCVVCAAVKYKDNKLKVQAQHKNWWAKNRERECAKRRKWNAENAAHVSAQNKAYRMRDIEATRTRERERAIKRRAETPEIENARSRAWALSNPYKRAEAIRKYKAQNPEKQVVYAAKARKVLTNNYVRCQLDLRKGEHSQEDLLIAMKREAISLKRATRAAKTQLKETS